MKERKTFQEETIGEKWHREAMEESPLKAALVWAIAMLAVIALLFAAPEANAAELQAASTHSSEMQASYSKWKSKMTAKQRKACLELIEEGTPQAKLKFNRYIDRAKLYKVPGYRKFTDKKVKSVKKWGKRLDRYLKKTPMKKTGNLIAAQAYSKGMDARLYPAIAKVESKCGYFPYGSKYNVCGWTWNPPAMKSWHDAAKKWHRYFKPYFGKERYPIKSMHGYGSYGPSYVNKEMRKI